MNIDVFGRIRATGPSNIHTDGQHRVTSGPGGTYFSFQKVLHQESSNYDVYQTCVDSLVDLFLAGFNTCVLVTGETGSGKSSTIGGDCGSRPGIANMVIDNVFKKLAEDDNRYMYDTKVKRHSAAVSLQMYEVYNETVKDLLQIPGMGPAYLDLEENSSDGVYVKNGARITVSNSTDGVSVFRQGWSRRTEMVNDYGPAHVHSAVITYIDLQLHVGDNPHPNRSRFTLVELPGLEKLTENTHSLIMRDGPKVKQAVGSLNRVVSALSTDTSPNRVVNYSHSRLTRLLQEEIGGNCKTKAIVCLKSQSNPDVLSTVLRFSSHLSQVKNFPILNDSFAQNLLTQYRASLLQLQRQSGLGVHGPAAGASNVKDELHVLQSENVQLRDQVERLTLRLDQMNGKFGNLATTKTDLSQQLLMTEEEKLKVSQSLVEMQIENNRLKEEAESTKFELTNKILALENELMQAEVARDKLAKVNRNATDRLEELEQDRKDLADEYVVLKTNYLALTKEHEREVSRNEELSLELLNLVNAKATLMKQLEVAEKRNYRLGNADEEVDRVRAMVGRYSRRKTEDILGSQREREDMERQLFGNQRRFDSEIDKMKSQHEESMQKLEDKIASLTDQLQDSRNLARDKQQKVSELNAKLITIRSEKEQLESLYNRSQHKMKDVNEECRTRLIKYVEDIAQYMDKVHDTNQLVKTETKMRSYVDSMLKDIRKLFKNREEQLGQAVQQFKARLKQAIQKHEELIVAYRNLQFKCRSQGMSSDETGPDETTFYLPDADFQTTQQLEIRRLKDELNTALNEVDTLKLRLSTVGDKLVDSWEKKEMGQVGGMRNAEHWAALRKQLREFTLNTQQQLEDERAELLTKNHVLEEQLKECQNYIDSHLLRYKEEIVRLRRRYGEDERQVLL
ncbi:coiled-coil domain-containing protein 78-like isoform X2 [Liolophura sinensis]|uniref:coiled-coil domain-containing protein 78-like isoform X2 n=1 Tax=Liolophura sinensis TaxID=3198878 RepID=UPI003158357B